MHYTQLNGLLSIAAFLLIRSKAADTIPSLQPQQRIPNSPEVIAAQLQSDSKPAQLDEIVTLIRTNSDNSTAINTPIVKPSSSSLSYGLSKDDPKRLDVVPDELSEIAKDKKEGSINNQTQEQMLNTNTEKTEPTISQASIPTFAAELTPSTEAASSTEIIPTPSELTLNFTNSSQSSNSTDNDNINNLTNSSYELNGNYFLSFDEWRQAKVSLEYQKKLQQQNIGTPKRSTPQISRVALGEEMEIDISNFFPTQNKEPEGKLYKDKFNYASFDCGASIVKSNSEAKGATAILSEHKDSYMLNPCNAANQFFIIELCQDILVDSVVLGNFEFFSSTFKEFQISVSETFPVQSQSDWKVLGKYEAKDVRDLQTFNITNPMIWAKYIRLEILDHYGSEYYCPLSVVRVHGKTMMQEYKQEEALQKSQILEEERQALEQTEQALVVGEECQASEGNITESDIDKINSERCPYNKDANITKLLKGLEIDECSVSLPQLKFEQIFKNFTNADKCEPKSVPMPPTAAAPSSSTGTQESIYKNIMKRLGLLEANATLSILYIEEQSKMISDAFASLERKHATNLESIIKTFNDTITNEITNFNNIFYSYQKQNSELFQSQQYQTEQMLESAKHRIGDIASQLKTQKIWNFINTVVLVCLSIYILLTRDVDIDMTEDEIEGGNERYKSPIRRTFAGLTRSRSPKTPVTIGSSSSSVNIQFDNTPINKVKSATSPFSSTSSPTSNKENQAHSRLLTQRNANTVRISTSKLVKDQTITVSDEDEDRENYDHMDVPLTPRDTSDDDDTYDDDHDAKY